MAQRSLADLYGRFSGRVDALSREFLVAPPSPLVTFGETPVRTIISYSRGFLVNRLFHLWGEFCRLVVIQSALGGCRTLSGVTLLNAPNISRLSDIPHIIKQSSTAGPSLNWGEPFWTAKQVNTLMLANRAQIVLGVGSAPFDTFRRVRNFVVHPNPHTREKFDEIVFPGFLVVGAEAEDLLLYRLPGGGTVFEAWGQEFKNAALNVVW